MNKTRLIGTLIWLLMCALCVPAVFADKPGKDKPKIDYAQLTPNLYEQLSRRTDIPSEDKKDIQYGLSNPDDREEAIVPIDGRALYVVNAGWTVAIALIDQDGKFEDVRYFGAKGGFSVDWYQGLIITIHDHPGTGMSYHDPERVTVVGNKLHLERTDPDWPAKHTD